VGLEAAAEYERMNDIRLYMSVLRILYENEFKTRSSITISGARIFDVGAVWGKTEVLGWQRIVDAAERLETRKLKYRWQKKGFCNIHCSVSKTAQFLFLQ